MAKKTVYKQFDVPHTGSGVVDLDAADFIDSSFIDTDGYIKLAEQAGANSPGAGKGMLWVKDDSPTTAWFTNSNGVDFQLGLGGLIPSLDGYVVGPASATDTAIATYDGATGKLIQSTGVTIDGSDNLTLPSELRFSSGGNYIGFDAPALSGNQIWTLPAEDGYSGSLLSTDGAGILSWIGLPGAITFIDSTSNQNESTALTLTAPTGIQDGDLLVAIICHTNVEDVTGGWSVPSGFSNIASDEQTASTTSTPSVWIWTKFASSEAGNYTFTPTQSPSSQSLLGVMLCYRGVDSVTPQDTSYTKSTGSSATVSPPSITTLTDSARAIIVAFKDNYAEAIENQPPPTGYTQREIVTGNNPSNGNGGSMGVCDREVLTAGLENPTDFNALSASEQWGSITLALRAAAASPVFGIGESTDNAIVRWNGTTGNAIQNSSVTIDDSGNMDLGSGNITTSGTVDGVDVSAHASRHENTGADEISVAGLSGELADAQKVAVSKNSGATVGTRSTLNFIEGSNITLTIADDGGGNEVDITIASTGSVPSLDGYVVGPAGATDNAITRYDGTTGKLVQDSSRTTLLDDGSIEISTTGSSTGSPRRLAFTNFASTEAYRWETASNDGMQSQFGGAVTLYSYNGLVLRGSRNTSAPSFDPDVNIGVSIVNAQTTERALLVQAASGQTTKDTHGDLQQWSPYNATIGSGAPLVRIAADGTVQVERNHDASAGAPTIMFVDTNGDIVSNDDLARIEFRADDSSSELLGAYIRAQATATWTAGTANDRPTRLQFYCESDGGTSGLSSAALTINNLGLVVDGGESADKGIVTFGGEYAVSPTTGGVTVNWNHGQKQGFQMTGNVTITFTNPAGPCNVVLRIQQSSGGSNTVTWPAAVQWPGGTDPVQTTTASRTDIYSFYFNGSTYYGVASQNFS